MPQEFTQIHPQKFSKSPMFLYEYVVIVKIVKCLHVHWLTLTCRADFWSPVILINQLSITVCINDFYTVPAPVTETFCASRGCPLTPLYFISTFALRVTIIIICSLWELVSFTFAYILGSFPRFLASHVGKSIELLQDCKEQCASNPGFIRVSILTNKKNHSQR